MAIELVTGYAGQGHVSSADTGRYNAGICGTGKYVLDTGTKFAYTQESGTVIRIGSGDAVDQGRHIIIPQGSYEDVTIPGGTSGKTRIDVIALRYEKDTTTGVETASLVVISGTEVGSSSTPSVPSLTSGNIFNGAAADEMALYHVRVTNMVIQAITPVFTVMPSLSGMLDRVYPVGAIYMSVVSTSPATFFGGTWQEIQGVFLLGRSSGHVAGSTGGAETVALTANQMPAHTHTGPSHTHNGPSHSHSIPAHTHTGPSHSHSIPAHTHTASSASNGAHTHTVGHTKQAAAGTSKWASQSDSGGAAMTTSSAGSHTHSITVNSGGSGNTGAAGTGNTGSGGGGNTGASGTGATSAAGTGNTGSAGGGGAHNNMPPFLSVYMWKRTA